ncbi:MAG: 3-hydroxyacyl-CoA dehydrogenase NAD-binding domain-containing protein [Bacteroidota bacterium]
MSTQSSEKKSVLDQYQKITVIGAGAIGLSWTALFLANGLKVTVNDPRADLVEATLKGIEEISPTLSALGYNVKDLVKNLSFETDLNKAIKDADIIQENGPENVAFKQNLYVQIEANLKPGALVLSSSSGIPATIFSEKMKDGSRVLIGHPFNPPHLIPLVEIVPGKRTSREAIEKAKEFYSAIGKNPIVIEQEIPGFVANRLQAALFRESINLVNKGVVTMEELDQIVSNSIGLRWAAAGPFKTFTLGGGTGGFPHFIKHFSSPLEAMWKDLGHPQFDKDTTELLLEQSNNSYGKIPYEQLAKVRDEQQLAILHALGK